MRWIRSWLFLAVVAPLLLLGLYAAAGFWGVPKLIRSQATQYVRDELGKDLALGEIRFNPFTFELDMRDIAIADAGQRQPVVALQHLFADFQAASLWKRAYVFRQVQLEVPFARPIIRPDGSLNLIELLPKSEDDGPMPDVWIEELVVARGRVDFADHSRRLKPAKRLAPIEFTLRDFRTRAESGGFQLSAASEHGERFDWQGRLSLQPLASNGRFGIGRLKAHSIYEFLSEELPFQLSSGSVDLAGSYVFAVVPKAATQLDIVLSKASATDLGLRARDITRDWVSVPAVALDNTRLSLAKRTIDIDAVRIDGLKAALWMEADGTLNLERLFAVTPEPVAAPVASGASAPATAWQVTLGRVELQQGDVDFEDRSVKPAAKFKLAPLAATAAGLSLDLTRPVPIDVQATINGRAPVTLHGEVVPDTAAATLQVELAKLPLRDVLAYLPDYPRLRLRSGEVGAKGRLILLPEPAPGPSVSFDGATTVTRLDLVEAVDESEFLSWERMEAQGVRYTQAPDALTIAGIHARKPQVRVVITPDRDINLARARTAPAAAAPAAPAPAAAEMPIRIDRIRLDGGVMAFADYSIDPNFQARIEALDGTIRHFSTDPDTVAKLDLNGQVINRYSPVSIKGETRPFAYDRHTDITMSFKNIELPLFNPYSGRFAGYAIAKGKLSTELHYKIDDRKLAAEHHVVLDQLEWGQATDSKDKVSLPIRLATSLLKNRHGVIDLNLPIAGTLDDPKFRVGPVVWQIIKNIVVKVVTAPFDFLGSLFQGAEQAQFVAFAPGTAELSEQARTSLGALAKGLADRPALKIDVPTGIAVPVDPDALAEQRLLNALAALGGPNGDAAPALASLAPEQQAQWLSKLYKQVLGSKPKPPELAAAEVAEDATRQQKRALREQGEAAWLRGELMAHYRVGEAELGALGQARAHAIQEALLAGGELDPTRVFVTAAGKPTTVQDGAVRLELGLE